MHKIVILIVSAHLFALTVHGTNSTARPGSLQPSLEAFKRRVEVARGQLPQIIAAAEAAAQRKLTHTGALLTLTYRNQPSFAEELINRSGGLADFLPEDDRRNLLTTNDFAIFSIRAWEVDGEQGMAYLRTCRSNGWTTILFASAAGKPDDLDVDFFIDNGAAGGGAADEAVNVLANSLNSWLWVCEYASALTRLGKHPGILQSITTPGSKLHNSIYQQQTTRHLVYPCETAVPARDLAQIYLRRVERLINDVSTIEAQAQLKTAAAIIAARISGGGRVFAATCTHLLLNEISHSTRTPWKPLYILSTEQGHRTLAQNTRPGDLLVWISFNGVGVWSYPANNAPSSVYIDAARFIGAAEVDLITCFAYDPLHPENNGQGALAHIEQPWSYGDAEVPVPFPPGRIAPVSGICQGLLYRMLDDETSMMLH